jgi:hypothetical protein
MLAEHRDKLDGFFGDTEVHGVRKPAKQRPWNIVFDFRKLKRTGDDPPENGIDLVEEFITQSGPSPLVPLHRNEPIGRCRRR